VPVLLQRKTNKEEAYAKVITYCDLHDLKQSVSFHKCKIKMVGI
jgi:hypothetical protein